VLTQVAMAPSRTSLEPTPITDSPNHQLGEEREKKYTLDCPWRKGEEMGLKLQRKEKSAD